MRLVTRAEKHEAAKGFAPPAFFKLDRAHRMDAKSAFWAAINYLAKNRFDREQLPPGEAEVELTVSGTVRAKGLRKKAISESFIGKLNIAEDQTSACSSAPNAAHLIALLLADHPNAERALQNVEAYFAQHKALKAVAAEKIAAIDLVLKRLRQVANVTKSGSITFKVLTNE